MTNSDSLQNCRVVRLNARLMPVDAQEAEIYRLYNLQPLEVEATTPDEIIPYVEDCDALFAISVSLPEPVIAQLKRCRIISRLGNGTDKIAVEAATRKGIIVSNVPDFCYQEMADHVMAAILWFSRSFRQMQQYMRTGDFDRARTEGLQLQRLNTKVLGMIGFGLSARALAERARPFGLRVIATRRNPHADDEARALGVELVDLETLLAASDYVSLHCPLTPETYHLLDLGRLRSMKPGAYLINTARGAIVDETALVQVLREGPLAGAALDTFHEIEIFGASGTLPLHPLMELDNVVLTPHISGLSAQAAEHVHWVGIRNVVAVLKGYLPPRANIVNKSVVPRFPLREHDPAVFQVYSQPITRDT